MRPGMASLLRVLLGQDGCCSMEDSEWDAMLAIAEEEHVAAWLAASLRDSHTPITQKRQSDLEKTERLSMVEAFYWSCELKSLLDAFARRAVPVVPLKGPFLAERLYGAVALRGCRDLDLLVDAADMERAEGVLIEAGFVPGELDDYHRAWSRHGNVVELHYDVENPLAYDFDVAGALHRAQDSKFQGAVCRKLAPEDELLYLCLHAARHRYERLSLVVDLRLAFEKLKSAGAQWDPRNGVRDLDGLMAFGLSMVRLMDPLFQANIKICISAKYRANLESVANELWRDLLSRKSQPLDWRTAHEFFVAIEQPGWARLRRRARHLRILWGRVIEADTVFAARYGLHQTWHARLLRPLRLASEAIGEWRGDG